MKILIIQTAFIGDVVLATPLIEKLRRFYPDATLDVLVRQGNEGLLTQHPYLRKTLIWHKKKRKYQHLWQVLRTIRAERYDWVINCQRFAASGLLTILSGARHTVGFAKNPFSWAFSRRVEHKIGAAADSVFGLEYQHEVERNLALIEHLTDASAQVPRLYPSPHDTQKITNLTNGQRYVCMAPTSVWFTKQWPAERWAELVGLQDVGTRVYLLGGPGDRTACAAIAAASGHPNVHTLAGELSFLESAALMAGAAMNYVNDSAPLHFASALDAPVTAIFCSTLPEFGFTPLSANARVVQCSEKLTCRPCGLHGKSACPQGHFRCAWGISADFVF
jgi:heptosyltransferase II